MEINSSPQSVESNTQIPGSKIKDSLTSANIITVFVIIILELLLLFKIAYFFALDQVSGGWEALGALPFMILTSFLSATGILIGIVYLSKKKFNVLTLLLILVSLVTFPSVGISRNLISPMLEGDARKNKEQAFEEKMEEYNSSQQDLYIKTEIELKRPQMVIAVDEKYAMVILETGHIVLPYGVFDIKYKEFIAWSKGNLVGKRVTISLPPINDINLLPCSSGYESTVLNIRKQYGLEDYASGICNIFHADIYLDGELINSKFK